MTDALAAALIGAASYRVWRAIAIDRWGQWLRRLIRVEGRDPDESLWAYFVSCPWCLGSIIAFALTTVAAATGALSASTAWLVALAAATVTGLIADRS